MRNPASDIKRRMVPRWRTLAMTPPAELKSAGKAVIVRAPLVDRAELEAEWKVERSLWVAADLVSLSNLTDRSEDSDEAAIYLQENRAGLPASVLSSLIRYEGASLSNHPKEEPYKRHYSKINRLKKLRDAYPSNPIVYVELARHYVTLGQLGPARAMFDVATRLAPHNRYVVRSAARFYIHDSDLVRAYDVIVRSGGNDPWIWASKVAVSQMAEIPVDGVKSARNIISNSAPSQHTELSAALGTLDLVSGSYKSARKHFRESAENPNDNTVAQLRWANEFAGVPFDRGMLQTELSFEARTGQAISDCKWQEVVDNAAKWLNDEPFSVRAAHMGSFYASEIVRDYDLLEWFSDAALMTSPNSPGFLNNRAYARLNNGKVVEGHKDILTARAHNPSETDKIYLSATEGCYHYRSGDAVGGLMKYLEAIEAAQNLNDSDALKAAFIHLAYEESLIGRSFTAELSDRMAAAIQIDNEKPVVQAMFKAHLGAHSDGDANEVGKRADTVAGQARELHPSVFELPAWMNKWGRKS